MNRGFAAATVAAAFLGMAAPITAQSDTAGLDPRIQKLVGSISAERL
jgi:hypothetical protein